MPRECWSRPRRRPPLRTGSCDLPRVAGRRPPNSHHGELRCRPQGPPPRGLRHRTPAVGPPPRGAALQATAPPSTAAAARAVATTAHENAIQILRKGEKTWSSSPPQSLRPPGFWQPSRTAARQGKGRGRQRDRGGGGSHRDRVRFAYLSCQKKQFTYFD
jgi:hypothetical protein